MNAEIPQEMVEKIYTQRIIPESHPNSPTSKAKAKNVLAIQRDLGEMVYAILLDEMNRFYFGKR